MLTVVALLMFVNGEIKEARCAKKGMAKCIRGKTYMQRDNIVRSVSYKCYKGKAEIELYNIEVENIRKL